MFFLCRLGCKVGVINQNLTSIHINLYSNNATNNATYKKTLDYCGENGVYECCHTFLKSTV
jgi:hypothetical protein